MDDFVSQQTWDEWTAKKPIANAGVVVLNEKNHVLLVFRATGFSKGFWELPSGSLGRYEQPRDAAARELLEETGIAVTPGTLKELTTISAFHQVRTDVITLFYVRVRTQPITLSEEHSKYEWTDEWQTYPMYGSVAPVIREAIKLAYERLK